MMASMRNLHEPELSRLNVHVLVKVAPPEHLPHGGVEPQFGEAQE
jgi:hypothetical protein